jgi:hypothetical protein
MNIVSCALPCFSDPSKLAKFISVVRQMPPHINQRNGRSQFSRPIHMNQKMSGSYHTESFGFNGGGCGFGGPYDYLACRTITFAFACGASVSSLRANIKAATARLLDQVSRISTTERNISGPAQRKRYSRAWRARVRLTSPPERRRWWCATAVRPPDI